MRSALSSFLVGRRPNPGNPCLIETCTPERYLDRHPPWQEVEQWPFEESARDAIAAPSFEWTPALLARIRRGDETLFMGAFGASEIVDLGPRSEAAKRHPWRGGKSDPGVSMTLLPWPEAWRTCRSAAVMLYAAVSVIPRPSLVLAATMCARTVLPLQTTLTLEHIDIIEKTEACARGLMGLDKLRTAVARVGPPIEDWDVASYFASSSILHAPKILLEPENAAQHAKAIVYSATFAFTAEIPTPEGLPRRLEVSALLASKVRNEVPFREVIEGLVGLRETP